jgi:hypothetical protein
VIARLFGDHRKRNEYGPGFDRGNSNKGSITIPKSKIGGQEPAVPRTNLIFFGLGGTGTCDLALTLE